MVIICLNMNVFSISSLVKVITCLIKYESSLHFTKSSAKREKRTLCVFRFQRKGTWHLCVNGAKFFWPMILGV